MQNDYQLDRANFYHQSGHHQEAIDLLKELLSKDPNEPIYHGLLASCLLATKRLHAAEHEVGVAMQLDPQLPFLLLVKGRISVYKNKHKEALTYCDDALTNEPEFVDALLLKGTIHSLMGNKKEELSCIQQALTLAPDSVDAVMALGDYYYSIGKLSDALEIAKSALAISAEDEDANLLMGRVQLDSGNVEEAAYHAKFVIMQNPNSDRALTLFSNIKMRQNWLLGLWWRFNSKIGKLGNLKASLILVLGYLLFMLLAQVFRDFGYNTAATITSFAWLIFVIYSWVGIPLYYKQLKKELEKFQFDKDY